MTESRHLGTAYSLRAVGGCPCELTTLFRVGYRLVTFTILDRQTRLLLAHLPESGAGRARSWGFPACRCRRHCWGAGSLDYQPGPSQLNERGKHRPYVACPDNCDREKDNLLENAGPALCFKTTPSSSSVLKSCVAHRIDIGKFATGIAVTRLTGQTSVSRVRAWE